MSRLNQFILESRWTISPEFEDNLLKVVHADTLTFDLYSSSSNMKPEATAVESRGRNLTSVIVFGVLIGESDAEQQCCSVTVLSPWLCPVCTVC